MKKYVVSYDKKSQKYYAHMKGYDYIPVAGSFCEKHSDAREYAKMMMYLPNRVEQIEDEKREIFCQYING